MILNESTTTSAIDLKLIAYYRYLILWLYTHSLHKETKRIWIYDREKDDSSPIKSIFLP